MKNFKKIVLGIVISVSTLTIAQTTIYTNDMDYVIGDVKQGFIRDKIKTLEQMNNLLAGFEAMKVNGIRVPIFPTGLEPDKNALEYFIVLATEKGFPIFANPAQGSGGQRIACESLDEEDRVAVKDDAEKRQILIDRILEIDKNNPDIKWINPFNEDAKTGTVWSVADMNDIYSQLYAKLENSELIGSCAWGIPASIDVFEKTNIKDYITVSATHNLGFNHSDWTEFINISHAAGLPVWDSEVNHNKKYETKATRLEAAIEYGVDGLVLYDSYNAIDLATGEISASAQTWMDLYLKPTAINDVEETNVFADIYQDGYGFRVNFLNSAQSYKVSIVDITGKQIRLYSNISDDILEVSNLQKGMYLVAISAHDQIQVEKVMVH